MFDLVIENGRIVDGTGNPWYLGDVVVSDGRIVTIGKTKEESERFIDANGLVVAPGFIDSHSHSDLMIIAEPEARQKTMQGVTTEVVGQDGLGEAPIRDDLVDEWRRYLSGLNGDPDIEWSWGSFGEYLNAIEAAGPSTNIVALVGHGNLRLLAMGMEDRRPSKAELEEMKGLLSGSLDDGAFGLSTGLIYPPCVYADAEELTELCRVVSSGGGVFVVHMRTGEFHIFKAKAVIIATGMDQMRLFRAQSGDWFNSQSPPYITGDGEAMALRAGAEVFILPAGKTRNAGFQYFRNLSRSSGTATTCYPAGRFVNSEGETMIRHPAVREPLRRRRENVDRSIAEGKTPFYLDWTGATEEEIRYAEWSYGNEGLCWVILEIMKDLGLDFRRDAFELELEPAGRLTGGFLALFIDTDCATNLPGLYACSPVQFVGEVAAPTYVVLGWRSGEKAAEYALKAADSALDEGQAESQERRVTAPLTAEGGHPWQEVNKELNNIMEEYKGYVAGWNLPGEEAEVSRAGLRNCIAQLEELKRAEMKAGDPHELVRCNEVMNLIDIGKMMVRAALEPGQHGRGVWFLGRQVDGEPAFRVKPIVVKYPSKEGA